MLPPNLARALAKGTAHVLFCFVFLFCFCFLFFNQPTKLCGFFCLMCLIQLCEKLNDVPDFGLILHKLHCILLCVNSQISVIYTFKKCYKHDEGDILCRKHLKTNSWSQMKNRNFWPFVWGNHSDDFYNSAINMIKCIRIRIIKIKINKHLKLSSLGRPTHAS